MEGPRLTWESTAASTAVLTIAALLYAWAVKKVVRGVLMGLVILVWASACALIWLGSRRERGP